MRLLLFFMFLSQLFHVASESKPVYSTLFLRKTHLPQGTFTPLRGFSPFFTPLFLWNVENSVEKVESPYI